MEKAELDRLMGSPLGVAIYARVSAKKQQVRCNGGYRKSLVSGALLRGELENRPTMYSGGDMLGYWDQVSNR